jgi:putative endonuclease
MKTIKTLDLYIAAIPETPAYRPLLPAERQALIEATRNEAVKAHRYCAWDTLLKGLKHSCGLDAENAGLSKTESGKWVSPVCGVSISHCRTAVAAAVSAHAVGVDIEPLADARYRPELLQRIASEEEQTLFPTFPAEQRVAVLWTRKEAAFKRNADGLSTPIGADAAQSGIRSIVIRLAETDYAVAAAAEEGLKLRVFEVRGETITERTDFTRLMPTEQPRYDVYILRCAGDRLYTGVTNDPERRFSEHCGTARGARFTRAFRPEAIAALWETDSRSNAQKLEAQIKRLPRAKKERLIAEDAFGLFGGAVDPDAYRRIR